MNQMIVPEVRFFLSSVIMGLVLDIFYIGLRMIRKCVPHSKAMCNAQDILYFFTVGIMTFGVIYIENEGVLRWFAYFGNFLGALIGEKTFGRLERAMKKTKKRSRNRKKVICLSALFLLLFSLFIGYRSMSVLAERDELQRQLLQAQKEYDDETFRTQELAEQSDFMRTIKYIEKLAREKLGLVYEDEIIIVPEE